MHIVIQKVSTICVEVILLRKFKIPVIPSTTNKTIRFPNNLIDEIEKKIVGKDCTFSAFVIEAVRVALENLHEEQEKEEK